MSAAFCRPTADCPSGNDAVDSFRCAIEQGLIVAVKGIGGFHLACNAQNDEAIARLRQRKGRIDKPFAVMVSELEAARRIAHVDGEEERLLNSKERPIVLLKRRTDAHGLSELVAPGNDYVGILFPYSPLHHLLVSEMPPLVMTSGNLSEEPIVRTNEEARQRLSSLADVFLLHDREIHVVCDDSVIRVFPGRQMPIRRSRGYAPMPIRLSSSGPSVLAVGGELKATFCLAKDDYAYMSQHIGDMGNLETLDALGRGVTHFRDLFRVDPEVVACDLHPGYLSTQWAKEYAAEHGITCVQVQHHHAHIASVATEHNYEGTVIGVGFDGTGYGTDGTIWGGEVLLASRDGFDRVAHLKYVPLPGGDAGIRRPYRVALAHLWAADLPWHEQLPCVKACPATERSLLLRQLENDLNCVKTSSMGRLFDAVASLVGIRHEVNYEAQAAMEMEAMCTVDECVPAYNISMGRPPSNCDQLLATPLVDHGGRVAWRAACCHCRPFSRERRDTDR